MTVAKKDKNLARQLYQEGKSTKEISLECGVTIRTAQRWVNLFEKENVVVTNLADPEAEVAQPIPALEKIASVLTEQSIGINMSQNTARRLLNLADSAIKAVEAVLQSSDSSDVNKLKAAQLVGKWVGLEEQNERYNSSVLSVVTEKLGLEASIENSEASEITLTPKMVVKKRQQETEEPSPLDRLINSLEERI